MPGISLPGVDSLYTILQETDVHFAVDHSNLASKRTDKIGLTSALIMAFYRYFEILVPLVIVYY